MYESPIIVNLCEDFNFDGVVTKGFLSSKFGKGEHKQLQAGYEPSMPFVTTSQTGNKIKIYSVYNLKFVGDDDFPTDPKKRKDLAIEFMKMVKSNPKDYQGIIRRTALYMSIICKKMKIDTIISTGSSAPLLDEVIKELSNYSPYINFFTDNFTKRAEPTFAKPTNMSDEDWERQLGNVNDIVKRSIEKHGSVKIKNLGQFRTYVDRLFIMKDGKKIPEKYLKGKNIAIIDDIVTKGVSVGMIAKEIESFKPTNIIGLTVFKTPKM